MIARADVEGVIALHGRVRHLINPKDRQPPQRHEDSGMALTACKRRYFVVYDAQHDRPLCDGCRRWLAENTER